MPPIGSTNRNEHHTKQTKQVTTKRQKLTKKRSRVKNFKRQRSEEDNGLDDELLTSHRHARETMNKRARRYLEQNKK